VCFYFVLRKIVPKMILQEIKDLVGENRLREALVTLENALPQSLQHQVVELKRQLTALESDSRIGLLTYSEEGTRRTKISLGILSLADEIENNNIHTFSNLKNQNEMGIFSKKTKCSKFFTYEAKTLDITGLSAGIGADQLSKFNFNIGQFKLSPEYVKVSEELMKMDIQQFSICQDIGNISEEKTKDELFKKVVEIKLKMMEMAANPAEYEKKATTAEKTTDTISTLNRPFTPKFRAVLTDGFNSVALDALIMDYFDEVYRNLGNGDKATKINALLEYCKQNECFQKLHDILKTEAPKNQFEKHQPYLE
jgi:hypothetical protein